MSAAVTGVSIPVIGKSFRAARSAFARRLDRFTQAGSEVSALLGRMPSAVDYQPNLASEMGEMQERITSTNKGSITSVRAIYVPADDYTDPAPAPATTFAHLDATTNLSRDIASLGIYPAVDPLLDARPQGGVGLGLIFHGLLTLPHGTRYP